MDNTFDETEDMEMPCMCDCGTWFDLNDGYSSRHSSKVICENCCTKEEDEHEREEEIQFLKEEISDAEITIEDSKITITDAIKKLKELNVDHNSDYID